MKEIRINNSQVGIETIDEAITVCAFLGPNGTYTEQAAKELLKSQVELTPKSTNTEVIRAVNSREVDLGFVPIENSLEGSVLETIRGLIRSELPDDSHIQIIGEKVIRINHILYGTENARKKGIVRSHPQALAQCSIWLNNNLPNAEIVRETSTAAGVKQAVERDEMAIGPRLAGVLYQAPILEERITDLDTNHTRFWLIGRGNTSQTGHDRVSLLFTLKNQPRALLKVLAPFAERGINMGKVDTVPLGTLDEYYFLMSLDGHIKDSNMALALEELGKEVWKMKVLGSFRKSTTDIIYDPEALKNGWVIV